MIIRPFVNSDIDAIDRIWRAHWEREFSVPDRRNAITDAVVEKDGRVVAYGQVRHFAESMLILDLNCSRRERITAIKLLMSEAFRGTDQAGLRYLYSFIRDQDFAALIADHFGFSVVSNPGELLLKEVSS